MKLTRESSLTPLNLHIAAVALLLAVNLVLLTRLLLAWHTLHTDNSAQIAQDRAQLRAIDLETRPLRSLPAKVAASREDAAALLDARMPTAYSAVSAELESLAQKNNVRLARVAYVQTPVLPDLAEVRMDAGLSGDYVPMMRFINGLERDRMFFVIQGLTLTAQQGGTVNLRLRVTTFLHGPDANLATPPALPAENTESAPTATNSGAPVFGTPDSGSPRSGTAVSGSGTAGPATAGSVTARSVTAASGTAAPATAARGE